MTTISIDLTKDPEVAALLADKEPGAKVYGRFSVKSRDDQTAVLRIEEMADSAGELKESNDSDEEMDEDEDDDAPEIADEGPAPEKAQSRGARMAAAMASGDGVSRM